MLDEIRERVHSSTLNKMVSLFVVQTCSTTSPLMSIFEDLGQNLSALSAS